ncbi:hypothetical protein FHS43_006738 [Streptosporangium becharense]|uniref:Peptidase inhibitor family I36 n=1 Tax=Streptosporangium becharense TaxID=1816182 RepID=A0A7W9IBD1_9ACTN|nr:peptidase inhibitor family I36 protein [Streptosporangium becharense]MBB2915418.1 hypothetical protein [Streptosporangium becharense]MBB5817605.1 hypothetical protein [Streptosporangium becharense]
MRTGKHLARLAAAATAAGLLCTGVTTPAQADPAVPAAPAGPALLTAPADPPTPAVPAGPPTDILRVTAQCGSGEICLWYHRDFQGTPWRWSPAGGHRDMPPYLRGHVHSFYANAPGCFIDRNPAQRRRVNVGDNARAYDVNFGRRIDAVSRFC